MEERGEDAFLKLLCGGDRKLQNIKFFPGNSRGLTAGQMKEEAERVIGNVLNSDVKNEPPLTGREKASISAFVSVI